MKNIALAAICLSALPSLAAISPAAVEAMKASMPMSFHGMPSGRNMKIHPLVSEEKRRPDAQVTVDLKTAQLVLTGFSEDGKCAEVAYPEGKDGEKYVKAWFKTDDVLSIGKGDPTNATAEASMLLFSPYGDKRPALFGTAEKGTAYADFGPRKIGRVTMNLVIADGGKRTVGGHELAGRLGYARPNPPVAGDDAKAYATRVLELLDEEPYRQGRHWDNTVRPLLVPSGNLGCAAIVTDFAKYVFDAGNFNKGEKFEKVDEIRAGDVISIKGHFLAVLDRDGDKLYTFEGNFNKGVRRTDSGYAVVKGQWWQDGKANPGNFICGYHYLKKPLPKSIGKQLKKKK